MLSPEQQGSLGDAEAEEASKVVDGLVVLLAMLGIERLRSSDADGDDPGDVTSRVLEYLAAHRLIRASTVRRTAQRAISASDAADAGALPDGPNRPRLPSGAGMSPAQAVERQVMAFLDRDNLSMAAGAQRAYRDAVAGAIRRYKAGMENLERAAARICRDIARSGVPMVDYASGRRTTADAAVRRHVYSMVNQAANERTLESCERLGVRLVEVSSHGGARPSHRRWQGRVYSISGDVTIGGVTYRDLRRATGYGTAGGLCGANCRHSFAPYTPGQKRRWSTTPDEDAGRDPDEVYKATQEQRANERDIRAAKREAMALREAGLDDTGARLALGKAQARQRALLKRHPYLDRRTDREQVWKSEPGGGAVAVRVSPLRKAPESGHQAGRERDERVRGGMPNAVRQAAQRKHIKGSKEYEEKADSMRRSGSPYPAPSYLTVSEDEADDLVRRFAGKGRAGMRRDGSWNGREVCTADRIIGYIVGRDGEEVPTRRFTIHYGKRGTHIVPARPEDDDAESR